MIRMRTWISFGLSLSFLGVCVPLLAQEPCTITVQPGESIQAAIDAASEGAVMCLEAGKWEENLVIEKPLTLRGKGADQTVIMGLETGLPVIRIESDEEIEVALEGLTVAKARAADPATGEEEGLRISGWARVTVSDSTIAENEGHGIEIQRNAVATIINSSVEGNRSHGILVLGQATITSSIIQGNRAGIWLMGSAKAAIVGSTVRENAGYAIDIWLGAEATVTGSIVTQNEGIGIAVWGRATITSSTIEGNRWAGILIADYSQSSIENNALRNNRGYAIALYEYQCFGVTLVFAGYLTGRDNTGGGNAEGDTCPDALAFLFTEEGGELDRRE